MKFRIISFVTLSLFVAQSHSTPITGAATGLSTPETTIDFGDGAFANNTIITNQFPGLLFGSDGDEWFYFSAFKTPTINGGHLIRSAPLQNPTVWTLIFDTNVFEAAFNFKAFSADTHFWTISSWLDDIQVETFTFNNVSEDGSLFYGFQNSLFNEIRITNLHEDAGFEFDNLQYSSVPEPGTLALLGLGLAGMGFAKRKKA